MAAASQTTPRLSTSSGIHTRNEGIFVRRSATPRQAVVSLLPPNALNKLMGRPTGSRLQEFHTVQYIENPAQYTFARLSGFGGASPQSCKQTVRHGDGRDIRPLSCPPAEPERFDQASLPCPLPPSHHKHQPLQPTHTMPCHSLTACRRHDAPLRTWEPWGPRVRT